MLRLSEALFRSDLEIISTTKGGTSQNSSDLSLGRRPESNSDEFYEVPHLVVEIMRCKMYGFFRKGDLFIGASLREPK